jgi:hypothetical protein
METKKTSGQLELERIRERNKITIADLSVCHHCKRTGLQEDETFCPNCGFPQRGAEAEQRRFIANFKVGKMQEENYVKAINKARIILFVLAGINLVLGALLGAVMNDPATIIASLFAAAIYGALGFWCKKKPFPAILTGFIVYITFIVIGALANPMSIVSGLIWKVIIISGFVYGYRGAKEAEHIKEQLELQKNGAQSNPDGTAS